MTSSLIRLSHVTRRYEEAGVQRTIFEDVSIEFARGEFAVLLGRSGSGKSTLLNLIGGIDDPTAGDVFIEEKNITRMGDEARTHPQALRRRCAGAGQHQCGGPVRNR